MHSEKITGKSEPGTWVVTEINGHRDKQFSEIMTQNWLKGLNNNITQTKCYGKHCLR